MKKIQRLQVSTGILFYLLFWRNILNRNQIEKEITQIIHPISPCFFLHISHRSVRFLALLVPDIFVHSFFLRYTQVILLNESQVCFLFCFLCFFLSLHYVFAYLSFCFNECLCQRSALLHINTQHPKEHTHIYIYIFIQMFIYTYMCGCMCKI